MKIKYKIKNKFSPRVKAETAFEMRIEDRMNVTPAVGNVSTKYGKKLTEVI